MAARTPIPSGLRGGNPEGEAGEERVGETRVAERAAARGDGENPESGPGALESWGRGSGPGGEREGAGAKEGAGRREIALGRGSGGMGTGGSSRRMGAGEGSWRWGGSRALELVVWELRAGGGSPELKKGLGVRAEALKGAVSRRVAWGMRKGMGVRAR